jgi:hypothetical protein
MPEHFRTNSTQEITGTWKVKNEELYLTFFFCVMGAAAAGLMFPLFGACHAETHQSSVHK